MAERKQSEDEFNPRHRIVGAVILVALAVIVLPMVLNNEPPAIGTAPLTPTPAPTPAADSRMTGVPPADKVAPPVADRDGPATPSRSTRIVTVPVEPVGTAPRAERPVNASSAKPAPVAPTATSVATVEPPPAPVSTASTSKKPAVTVHPTAASGWVVQVGVFSQAENARRLQERLKARGYAATLDPPGAPKGKTVRVEVGPYKDQAAAKSAAARIERDFAIQGIVRSQ